MSAGHPLDVDLPQPVLVIGSGLIGTSIALALRRAGVDVALDDRDDENVAVAVGRGAGRPARADEQPQIIVVAVPPSQAPGVLAAASTRWPDATLTDVTSVKEPVLTAAVAAGADPVRLVGGHPMAGREVSGAAGAVANLLDDRIWVLTPLPESGIEHVRRVHRLIVICGAQPIEMGMGEHDAAVALVSHAPQVLASALAGELGPADPEAVQIAGQGLRDMTRIAASNVTMWSDILAANAGSVADVLEAITDRLTRTAQALRAAEEGSADGAAITELLAAGVAGQARIPGKHGAAPAAVREVLVRIADRPGQLGELFSVAAAADINLEDVRIEHVLGRPSGLVGLFVRPDVGERLIEALSEHGFEVRS